VLSEPEREAENLDEFRGLLWQRPWLAGFFAGMLLSLAGIPLTAGFVGKFYVMRAGIGSALWFLVAILVINSVIGLFYYLRIIAAMYVQPAGQAQVSSEPKRIPFAAGVVCATLALLLLWLGIFPAPFISFIESTLIGS
jgi:NADH-quinone oxidoreductase subunit N